MKLKKLSATRVKTSEFIGSQHISIIAKKKESSKGKNRNDKASKQASEQLKTRIYSVIVGC